MKKIILGFMLSLVAIFALAVVPTPASAANCSISSATPQLISGGLRWPVNWTCSNVDMVQTDTWAFENTWSVGGDLGQSPQFNVTGYNCNTVVGGTGTSPIYGTCTFSSYINSVPCPFGASGIGPFWWGHGEKYRIHRPAGDGYAGSWGPWTSNWSQQSNGLYATCVN